MSSLPRRLQGFLDALAAISLDSNPYGGLSVTYPSDFDRNHTNVAWFSGLGTMRSGGSFIETDATGIARFLDQVLSDLSPPKPESRRALTQQFLDILKDELSVTTLEFWYNDDGANATLQICLAPGPRERWLELFWSMD